MSDLLIKDRGVPGIAPVTDPYLEFIAAKVPQTHLGGFPCDESEVNSWLKAHQRTIVATAVRYGCYLIAAAGGLGKSVMQLEYERLVLKKHAERTGEEGRGLIVIELAVLQEFLRDAARIGVPVTFVRSDAEIAGPGIYLATYDAVVERKIDVMQFVVSSLDEGDVLRSFGSKTFGELVFGPMMEVRYRLVATATPAPSEHYQIVAYAHYLGVADMGQIKTRYFKRNSEKAHDLTLLPGKEAEFWLWVASWSCWIQYPSDLGAEYSDEGYILPDLAVHYHEVPVDHAKNVQIQKNGQAKLLKDDAVGVTGGAREKRESMAGRVAKLKEIVESGDPDDHWLIWHDLEEERRAIDKAIPGVVSITGSGMSLETRMERIVGFSEGRITRFSAKPSIAGVGCNFQYHCHKMVFTGIGFKFKEFIQAIMRLQRFMQACRVEVHIIYSEAERGILETLKRRWEQDTKRRNMLREIIKQHGLSATGVHASLSRSLGVERREFRGVGFRRIRNDAVLETRTLPDNSVQMILTSIPFSTQYEYSPAYEDFGHTDDAEHFWKQMDFLTPHLHRVLEPGRILLLHIKDRVMPGGLTGRSYQTIDPTHCYAALHYIRHGFDCMGICTVKTDVVKENKGSYRLGWTEKCKDGTKMGFGMSEYLICFRKPPSDHSNGYADNPVRHDKGFYTRARWQIDADGVWRSNGNRSLTPAEIAELSTKSDIYRAWRAYCLRSDVGYDYDAHVRLAERLDQRGLLPPDFGLIPVHLPATPETEVWTDVTRMRTLNMEQARRNLEHHLCPFQYDIVDRGIEMFTMPGEVVFDPFGGIGTVVARALRMGRQGIDVELSESYWRDGNRYVEAEAEKAAMPTLFDLLDAEEEDEIPEALAA
jgi:DNA modification methylase